MWTECWLCITQGSEFQQVGPCEAVALPVVWQCVEEAANVVQVLEEEELCPEEQLEEYPEVRGLLLFILIQHICVAPVNCHF